MDYSSIKPYIQDTVSLLMSIICCVCLYKYTQTNNLQWFNIIWYFFLFYLIYDLYFESRIDFWIHHIPSIILTLISLIFPQIPFSILIPNFTAIGTETSSVFLSIKNLIRTYLRQNKSNLKTDSDSNIRTILKKIQPINDLLFVVLFTYTRVYLFNKNILFNPDLYISLSKSANFYMLDKIAIACFWTLGLLNMYWFVIISKKTINTVAGYDVFEYRPSSVDPFLLQIEEIKRVFVLGKRLSKTLS